MYLCLRKILLHIAICLLAVSFASAISCFQESFNTPNQTGVDSVDCNLNYNGSIQITQAADLYLVINDGNYSTGGHGDIGANAVNITWRKPAPSTNGSFWMVKDCIASQNISLNNCSSYNSNTIDLQIIASDLGGFQYNNAYYCKNSAGSYIFLNSTSTCTDNPLARGFYEESMYWNISGNPNEAVTYSNPIVEGSYAGTFINHSLLWNGSLGMDYYLFGYCNGSYANTSTASLIFNATQLDVINATGADNGGTTTWSSSFAVGTVATSQELTLVNNSDGLFFNRSALITNAEPWIRLEANINSSYQYNGFTVKLQARRFLTAGSEAATCYIANYNSQTWESFATLSNTNTNYTFTANSTYANYMNQSNNRISIQCIGANYDADEAVAADYFEIRMNYTYVVNNPLCSLPDAPLTYVTLNFTNTNISNFTLLATPVVGQTIKWCFVGFGRYGAINTTCESPFNYLTTGPSPPYEATEFVIKNSSFVIQGNPSTPGEQLSEVVNTPVQYTGYTFTNGSNAQSDIVYNGTHILTLTSTSGRWNFWTATVPPVYTGTVLGFSPGNLNGACFDGTNYWVTSGVAAIQSQVMRLNSTFGYDNFNFTVPATSLTALWCDNTTKLIGSTTLDQVLVYNNTNDYQYNISIVNQEGNLGCIALKDGILYVGGNTQMIWLYNFSTRLYIGQRYTSPFYTSLTGCEVTDNYVFMADAVRVAIYTNMSATTSLSMNATTTNLEVLGTSSTSIIDSQAIDYENGIICTARGGNDRLTCGIINDTYYNDTAYLNVVSSSGLCSFDTLFISSCDFNNPLFPDGVCSGGATIDDTAWIIGFNFSGGIGAGNFTCFASYTSASGTGSIDGINRFLTFWKGDHFDAFGSGPTDDTVINFNISSSGVFTPKYNRTAAANPCSQDTTDWFDVHNRSDGGYDWVTASNTDGVLCRLNTSSNLSTSIVYFYTDIAIPGEISNANRDVIIDEDDERVLLLSTLSNYPKGTFYTYGAGNFTWSYDHSYINTNTCAFQGSGPNVKSASNIVIPHIVLNERSNTLYANSFGLLGNFSGAMCAYNASPVYANNSLLEYPLPLLRVYKDNNPAANFSGNTQLWIDDNETQGWMVTSPGTGAVSPVGVWRFNMTALTNNPPVLGQIYELIIK